MGDTKNKTKHKEQNKDNNGNPENIITKLQNEIKTQKQEVLEFQSTFMQMRAEIYKLGAENKVFKVNQVEPVVKDKESKKHKENERSKSKDTETQTEPTHSENESNGRSGKEKYEHINCKYFVKGNGCKRGSYCWYSHKVEKVMERYCPYWWDGKCRYAAEFCRSGKHNYFANNQNMLCE